MTTTGEVLKPCPFCNGEAETRLVRDGWCVECQHCYMQTAHDLTEDKSIAAWNRRAQPDAAAIRNEPPPEDYITIAKLQTALNFWLPDMPDWENDVSARLEHDAWLLCGMPDLDDEPSAARLGIITLNHPNAIRALQSTTPAEPVKEVNPKEAFRRVQDLLEANAIFLSGQTINDLVAAASPTQSKDA